MTLNQHGIHTVLAHSTANRVPDKTTPTTTSYIEYIRYDNSLMLNLQFFFNFWLNSHHRNGCLLPGGG